MSRPDPERSMSKYRLDFSESPRKSIGLKTDSQLAGDLRKGKDSPDPLSAGAVLCHKEVLAPGLPQGRDDMAHSHLGDVLERQQFEQRTRGHDVGDPDFLPLHSALEGELDRLFSKHVRSG